MAVLGGRRTDHRHLLFASNCIADSRRRDAPRDGGLGDESKRRLCCPAPTGPTVSKPTPGWKLANRMADSGHWKNVAVGSSTADRSGDARDDLAGVRL